MDEVLTECLFCGGPVKSREDHETETARCCCANCGQYLLTFRAQTFLPVEITLQDRCHHLLSGCIRELTDKGITVKLHEPADLDTLFLRATPPATVFDQLDKLLLALYRRTGYLYEDLDAEGLVPAMAYARHQEELDNIRTALEDLGWLEQSKEHTKTRDLVHLTLDGIERASAIQRDVDSRRAFIATWFDEQIKAVHPAFAQAVCDAGYEPCIILNEEFNDTVVDRIIAEVRRSRFVVADLTGIRGGVYFEAGFGMGLGREVIFTCRKDYVEKLHFDVRNFNFLVWEGPEDLHEKLKNRIMATIPQRSSPQQPAG